MKKNKKRLVELIDDFDSMSIMRESLADELEAAGVGVDDGSDHLEPVPFTLYIMLSYKLYDDIVAEKKIPLQKIKDNFQKKWPKVVNNIYGILDSSPLFNDGNGNEDEYTLRIFYQNRDVMYDNKIKRYKPIDDTESNNGPLEDWEDKFEIFNKKENCIIAVQGVSNLFYDRADRHTSKIIEQMVKDIASSFLVLGLEKLEFFFDVCYKMDANTRKYADRNNQPLEIKLGSQKLLDKIKIYNNSVFDYQYDFNTDKIGDIVLDNVIDIPVDNSGKMPRDLFATFEKYSNTNVLDGNRSQMGLFRVIDGEISLSPADDKYDMNIWLEFDAKTPEETDMKRSIYLNTRTRNAAFKSFADANAYVNEHPEEIKLRCLYCLDSENMNNSANYAKIYRQKVVLLTNVFVVIEDLLFVFGIYDKVVTHIRKDKDKNEKTIKNLKLTCSLVKKFTGNDDLAEILSGVFDIPAAVLAGNDAGAKIVADENN